MDEDLTELNENNTFEYEKLKDYRFDEEVGAVVCGLDVTVDYTKIALASMYI